MRMDPEAGQSAAQWLAQRRRARDRATSCASSARSASRAASRAPSSRPARPSPSRRTGQLAAIVAAAVPTREPGKHPATRSFQAIRIHVNGELERARSRAAAGRAPAGAGRPARASISFHSLEDRIVKRFIRARRSGDPALRRAAGRATARAAATDARRRRDHPPARRRWRPTRARAAPCCAWPRGSQHEHRAAGASPWRCCGSRCSARRWASSTPSTRRAAVRRAAEAHQRARRPRHRVGPAAARAEHLVHARARRARRARASSA